jgi:hypothetical protein
VIFDFGRCSGRHVGESLEKGQKGDQYNIK